MMRALVCGAKGQLGRALRSPLSDVEVDWVDVDDLDITDATAVDAWLCEHGPYDQVYNCAAFTNVDGCERDFGAAFAVNALGPMNLARACARTGSVLVHVSTDYVFPGTDPGDRLETDVPRPLSAYGRSKLAGEGLALASCPRTHVVRTAWLYGEGRNFVRTMLNLGRTHESVTVVDDQRGNPTFALDLARELVAIAQTEEYGIWHCTNEGTCSWADFAEAIFEMAGIDCRVRRCSSEEWREAYPESARRPAYSALKNARLAATIGNDMRPWREALQDYLSVECAPDAQD